MRFWFIDPMLLQYDVQSPLLRPTGGTGLAVVNTATELARRGHEVFVSTQCTPDDWYVSGGVTMAPLGWTNSEAIISKLESLCGRIDPDVVMVLNHAWVASVIRHFARPTTKWLLWPHNFDEPWVHQLQQPQIQASWDRIVFVSETQRNFYLSKYHNLTHVRGGSMVLYNALSATMAADDWEVTLTRGHVVAYTTMADRGLPFLLHVWPSIREAVPDAELWIFSPMVNYSETRITDPAHYPEWYRDMLGLDGTVYHGWQPHADLAKKLSQVRVVANCNYRVPETFCLTNIEAMARGCTVVTGNLGAIPEIVQDKAIVIDGPDVTAWRDAILKGLANWNINSAWTAREWAIETYDIRKSVDLFIRQLS